MTLTHDSLRALILDSLGEGVFTVDAGFRITSFNRAAEQITGVPRATALGMRCRDVFRSDICGDDCALARTMRSGRAEQEVPVRILDQDMAEHPIRVSTAALRDDDGELIGGVEIFRDVSELETLRAALADVHSFEDIVGVSRPMRALFALLPEVARAEVSVLIEGPSGTGKELVAEALHRLSPRAAGPYVRVNCAALPDTLLETELFGHRRGAFTGADRDRAGRFEQAHGGTLLLDEIGDTSPAFQVRLLRALEAGEIQPVGASSPLQVDVRVLASTHKDLAAEVAAGRFRQDLLYRLRVISLRLLPLRERPEDILPLTRHLLARLTLKRGGAPPEILPETHEALRDYAFPGNVRELRNLLEHALVMSRGGPIAVAHLPREVRAALAAPPASAGSPPPPTTPSESAPPRPGPRRWAPPTAPLDAAGERLLRALEEHAWNRTATAAALGISRSTLWRQLRAAGLAGPERR
ncbi:MAG: Fis family transcriptional regulator [Deltaproteobacteria bacterium HGW-Deltaproteobacteria-14]|jgi:PAS domain S-box-containing protein|nr:MAG: Fis family transcriptional regulator [Deltaproteobacteria bacterium HGW-Deltaproteobacteria-14]